MSYFKYTTLSTTKLILEHKSLRWSSPLQFNDIEECQFVPYTKESYNIAIREYFDILIRISKGEKLDYEYNRFSYSTQMLISLIRISLKNGTFNPSNFVDQTISHFSNPEADYRAFINKGLIRIFRILCVTNKYDNKLMWAHYGDQHYGCVLEFSDLYINKPYNLREGKVEYHENLYPKTNSIDLLLYGETQESTDLMFKDVVFSKRSEWKYEEEYRLLFAENLGQIKFETNFQTNQKELSISNQTDKLFTDVPIDINFIKSITFGARVNFGDITEIQNHLKSIDLNCDLYKMDLNGANLERKNL